MSARQQGLSAFFVVFLAFKIAEAALRLDSWPASNVSMFSGYRPPQFVPLHSRLEATRNGARVALSHVDFALSQDEFLGRLYADGGVAARCGKLIAAYNRTVKEPAGRLENASVVVEPVARPGRWTDVVGWTVACIVPAQNAGAGKP
jgi:hypothetical protein